MTKNIIVSDEALHCGGGRGVKPFSTVRAKPCLPCMVFVDSKKTELLVAFNITSGIEVSFFLQNHELCSFIDIRKRKIL